MKVPEKEQVAFMTEARQLFDNVISNDYCIGCGACALVENSPFSSEYDEYGNLVAVLKADPDQSDASVLDVCPFSDSASNEDELSEIAFPDIKDHSKTIGKYLNTYAGYVDSGDFRKKGSSGGMAKWIGSALLRENKIDHFIQLIPNETGDPNEPLFKYSVFTDPMEVIQGSRSSYYPVTLESVVEYMRENEGRYAVTGVPCFIKTLRLLSKRYPVIKERLKFTIGIICGGMKSANHSKMIGWQLGVHPSNLNGIEFRRKADEGPASIKLYQVYSNADDKERYQDSRSIFGTDWNGYFRPNACDYCDDVVGETADISIGDAWLPQYVKDSKGTSIMVVRNREIDELLEKFKNQKELVLDQVSADDVTQSQIGGFRQRHEALSMRIADKEKKGEWVPKKRIKANEFEIVPKRKKIYQLREKIAKESHTTFLQALKQDNYTKFYEMMLPLDKKYNRAVYGNRFVKIYRKVRNKLTPSKK